MKSHKIFLVVLPAFLLLTASCKPDLDEAVISTGNANLSHYVAFGDSFTAGFTNGGLYREGQAVSYPAIIAGQLRLAGGSVEFLQPYLEGTGTGYIKLTSVPAQVDTLTADPSAIRGPFQSANCYPFSGQNLLNRYTSGQASSLQNLGVPNIRLAALGAPNLGNVVSQPANPGGLNPALTANPYFERILPGENNSESYIQVAHSTQATFFTVWFGLDDMLNWALSGGTCGPRPIPANTVTGAAFTALLDTLAANGAKGVIGRIPRVVDFPYFKLVKYNDLVEKAKTATGDTAATVWHTLNNQAIKLSSSDIVLYHALPNIGVANADGHLHGFSPQNPLTNAEVLTPAEVGLLNGSAASFNLSLPQLLTGKRNFPLANIDDFITSIVAGYQYGGITYSGNYITGEFFSLDGLHFSARGNALIANKFIDEINKNYGASIPQVNPGDYPSIQRPD